MYASSASPLTPLDYTAAGYWQDFLADRPIAGGIAYEMELRDGLLDESLASLQRLDTLLSQIRRDMIKVGRWDEEATLLDERYRNFMVFLAFYAGRVLAQQWQNTPHWYGQFELRKRYSELALTTDDFYQNMAVIYRDDAGVESGSDSEASLFFALEPIGLRLFGHIDRPFEAVQGAQVANGLYQAVSTRLPNSNDKPTMAVAQSAAKNPDITTHIGNVKTIDSHQPVKQEWLNEASTDTPALKTFSQPDSQNQQVLSKEPPRTENGEPVKDTASEQAIPSQLSKNLPKKLSKQPLISPEPLASLSKDVPTPEMFTQLLVELDEIEVVQTSGQTEYQQAHKVLAQFERHIAKQDKPRAQINFAAHHLATKKQALLTLQAAAQTGNTAAMLRLAMYELLGEGLTVDERADAESGTEWVKQAASKNDCRAQRLLSKMYYQGVGVAQEITTGKYWLEQAAENGHAEATSLVQQWQKAEVLMTTQKQEQHSTKRYQLLFGVVTVVALLILIII